MSKQSLSSSSLPWRHLESRAQTLFEWSETEVAVRQCLQELNGKDVSYEGNIVVFAQRRALAVMRIPVRSDVAISSIDSGGAGLGA